MVVMWAYFVTEWTWSLSTGRLPWESVYGVLVWGVMVFKKHSLFCLTAEGDSRRYGTMHFKQEFWSQRWQFYRTAFRQDWLSGTLIRFIKLETLTGWSGCRRSDSWCYLLVLHMKTWSEYFGFCKSGRRGIAELPGDNHKESNSVKGMRRNLLKLGELSKIWLSS